MMSLRSSSRDHSSRLISGLRWLYHRSRHCFPMRPGSCCAILDHCFAPSWPTSSMILSSSSLVHGPLTSSGLRTFCQRWRHWTSVRSSKYSAVGGRQGGRGARGSVRNYSKFFKRCAGAFESHRVPWGVGRARTDLLPVLALVLRHGAAKDVVLLESRGSGDGQRYAGGAAGGRSKSRLSLKKSTLWAIFAGPRRRPETDCVGTPRGIFAGFDRAADVFDTHNDEPRRE